MFRKLLFQTRWRLAVSAILPFLLIGGIVINGAIESSRSDLERYLAWTPAQEKSCAEDRATIEGRLAFERDPYKEYWCTKPPEPNGVSHYALKIFKDDAFAPWIVVSLSVFLVLTSISLYIGEKVAGWKRLSVVVAAGLGLVSFLITLISWSSLRGDDAAFALLLSCAAFPFGVLLILGGRFTTQWVRAGFSDPAMPVMRPSVERESNSSPARETVTPQIMSTSTDANCSTSDRDKIIATPLAGAWRRFWARTIDIWLLSWVVVFCPSILLMVIDPALGSWLQRSGSNYIYGWLTFPVVLLAEAIVFGVFGNTPGKTLLGLRVTTVGGTKPSFNDHVSRLLGVYWFGLGTGFPIVSMFTMIKQYQRLKLGRETRYDSGRFNVRGHPLRRFRIALAVLVVFLLLAVPGIMKELGRTS